MWLGPTKMSASLLPKIDGHKIPIHRPGGSEDEDEFRPFAPNPKTSGPRFEDQIERRLRGASELGKTPSGDNFAEPLLSGLRAERQADFLG